MVVVVVVERNSGGGVQRTEAPPSKDRSTSNSGEAGYNRAGDVADTSFLPWLLSGKPSIILAT